VAAYGGYDRVLAAYREALAAGYRFFTFGDAMFLTPSISSRARVREPPA
jgi:S-adenosylmethionine:tRNA ribosyltransferase-isomerase